VNISLILQADPFLVLLSSSSLLVFYTPSGVIEKYLLQMRADCAIIIKLACGNLHRAASIIIINIPFGMRGLKKLKVFEYNSIAHYRRARQ
jgi:hypothetical protein